MLKGDLKPKACEVLFQEIVEQGCKIDLFLPDRHKGIRCDIRTKFLKIQHKFDIWHFFFIIKPAILTPRSRNSPAGITSESEDTAIVYCQKIQHYININIKPDINNIYRNKYTIYKIIKVYIYSTNNS